MSEDHFGDYFNDFLESIKPGSRVRNFGILRYRQGGDRSSWDQYGSYKYPPGEWQMMAGVRRWTGAAAATGNKTITMPVTFSDGFLVWATPVATVPIFEDVRLMCSISNNQEFTLVWWSTNNLTQLVFNWLAMGEVSLG